MSKNVEYRKNEMDMDDITWYRDAIIRHSTNALYNERHIHTTHRARAPHLPSLGEKQSDEWLRHRRRMAGWS